MWSGMTVLLAVLPGLTLNLNSGVPTSEGHLAAILVLSRDGEFCNQVVFT
jgi:hypothetical protein